jgi:hypothetical protein
MTDDTRHRYSEILKTVITLMAGAIMTLLLTTINKTESNTERIAKLEMIVEPLKTIPADVSWLKATADRNVSTLDRIEKKFDQHLATK